MQSDKLQVSTRALTQRINRALASLEKRLVFDRRTKEFVVITVNGKLSALRGIDIVKLARNLDVLKPYEELIQ